MRIDGAYRRSGNRSTKPATARGKPRLGEPAWDIAHFFPLQGGWEEEEYLDFTDSRSGIEFSDGFIEVLPMPTTSHQRIMAYLYRVLVAFVEASNLGEVFFHGIRARLRPGKIREPDLIFVKTEHADRVGERYWTGADLVAEIVSGSKEDRRRDLQVKRREYARASISEYWIVDPKEARITVLRLSRGKYAVHGRFGRGQQATSALLKGFGVSVDAVLSGKGA